MRTYNLNNDTDLEAYKATLNRINQTNDRAKIQVNVPTTEEPLFPTGFSVQANGEIETPMERIKRLSKTDKPQKHKSSADSNLLLPAGITLD